MSLLHAGLVSCCFGLVWLAKEDIHLARKGLTTIEPELEGRDRLESKARTCAVFCLVIMHCLFSFPLCIAFLNIKIAYCMKSFFITRKHSHPEPGTAHGMMPYCSITGDSLLTRVWAKNITQ